jgi:hypothetical protein
MHSLAFTIVQPWLELRVGIPWLLWEQRLLVGEAHPTMTYVLRTMLVDAVAYSSVVREVLVDVALEVVSQVKVTP